MVIGPPVSNNDSNNSSNDKAIKNRIEAYCAVWIYNKPHR